MSSSIAKVFPKTAIVTAEFDQCRRMGEELASVLDKEGKLCDFLVHPGTMHCWHLSMAHPKSDECTGVTWLRCCRSTFFNEGQTPEEFIVKIQVLSVLFGSRNPQD